MTASTITTTHAVKATELETQLHAAKRLGAIIGFEKKSTGKELLWRLDLPADDASLELKTREAGLFLLGVDLGRQLVGARRRTVNAIREAIESDGRAVVDIVDPEDVKTIRRLRNSLFANAYAVGLKGKFTVRREGDKLVGETTK